MQVTYGAALGLGVGLFFVCASGLKIMCPLQLQIRKQCICMASV
jgi:hypothetical protein